jgi:uroporphyrin-III C-methyltransferase
MKRGVRCVARSAARRRMRPTLIQPRRFVLRNSSARAKEKVYLVGAGPGDPDLLTVKAARLLGLADLVLHDALVSPEVLALVSPRAQLMNVGKRCGRKSITQDEINDLLVQFAAAGELVVRLKSGDPSIFGRAGEELDALREAGIEVEIIPGITASLAAAAKIGVSLTDRRKADQLLFITAHRGHGKQNPDLRGLMNERTTVVVYMPGEYEEVARHLRQTGLTETTPCAVVSKVSTRDEQWYQTTLGSLQNAPLMTPPSVLIVGETLRATAVERLRSAIVQNFSQADFAVPSAPPAEV